MQSAEIRNDIALAKNAQRKPRAATLAPPRNVPRVRVVQPVVWVSEFAVCSSYLVAMDGKMAERPLVKNGEAPISKPLST